MISETTLAQVPHDLVNAKLIIQTYSKPSERVRYGINLLSYDDYLKQCELGAVPGHIKNPTPRSMPVS